MHNVRRVVIHGRVQGVGYRAWTVAQATRLGLVGWVRNQSEGHVEAVFSGDNALIDQMIEACKEGPPAARVEKIETFTYKEELADGPFSARPDV
jgi:acylphosphatase